MGTLKRRKKEQRDREKGTERKRGKIKRGRELTKGHLGE